MNVLLIDRAIITYADLFRVCCIDDDESSSEDFGGYQVKHDGFFVIPKKSVLLDGEDLAQINWHPTGHYDQPALALPCTVGQLRTFVSEAGLLGCIDEDALEEVVSARAEQLAAGGVKPGTASDAQAPTEAVDTAKLAPVVAVGASGGVEPDAGPVDKAPAHEPQAARVGPRFSMPRAALISSHEHEWRNIRADIAGAANNELRAAKAGPRGWYEDIAMEWARAKGRLNTPVKPANELAAAVHSMASVPSRKHILKG